MRRHQPSRYDLKAFEVALQDVSRAPRLTSSYLAELERRRDQHLLKLAS